ASRLQALRGAGGNQKPTQCLVPDAGAFQTDVDGKSKARVRQLPLRCGEVLFTQEVVCESRPSRFRPAAEDFASKYRVGAPRVSARPEEQGFECRALFRIWT